MFKLQKIKGTLMFLIQHNNTVNNSIKT